MTQEERKTMSSEIENNELLNSMALDEQMFRRLEKLIVTDELYLQPRLSRKELIERTNIPKNKFAELFRTYAGKTFTNFVNDLRLTRAAEQLVAHPEYTIETIAMECGMPKMQTFYRVFAEKYGMTPSAYRKSRKNK